MYNTSMQTNQLLKETPEARRARLAQTQCGAKISSKTWGGRPTARKERKTFNHRNFQD